MSEALSLDRHDEASVTSESAAKSTSVEEQYWMSIMNHRRPNGETVVVDCNVYGDPNSPDSYRAKFLSNGGGEALGRVVLSGGIYTTGDRRKERIVEVAAQDSDDTAVQLRTTLWDFQTYYHSDNTVEMMQPVDESPRLDLIITPKNA